ncbi:hypothetical protein PDJAM_G00012390 [Pangasius djambal]|uniref:Uncharacterized protein n=1 Tax=Pangasius djambal TaxID=1691987 RepID=A0ACC5YLF1_9TELE|nr:hypothetical protein [Pangasius djambal]
MASDSSCSSPSLESQDDWSIAVWMEGDCDAEDDAGRRGHAAPRAQEEETHSSLSEQEVTESQTGAEAVLCHCDATFTPEEGAVRSSSDLTDTDDVMEHHKWPEMVECENEGGVWSDGHDTSQTDQSELTQELSDDSFKAQGVDFTFYNDSNAFCLNAKTGSGRGYKHQTHQSSLDQEAESLEDSISFLPEDQDEGKRKSGGDQQGAPETPDPAQHQEVQQVYKSTPPLETVADETANRDPGNLSCRSFMVSECLIIEAAGWREAERESEDREDETGSRSDKVQIRQETQRHTEDLRREQRRNMDLDQYDDNQSDSGVSADFSPNSMSDNETPIEREIRLAFKREQSLRRSRGLDETKEFIEIPLRKSILSQDLPEKSVKDHGKERQFAGKKMQREIHAEAEREKVLVKLGRLPGFYDKGTVRQLQEKKLLFEVFQESKDPQIPSDRTQEPINSLEMIFQNHSPFQPIETSPKDLQISRNQDHETFRTDQEPKNEGKSCISSCKIINGGNQDCSSKEHARHLELDSSPQLFSSLKEKKLLFESLQENKNLQTSRDQDNEVSGSFKEQRKSMDIFFQNQNSGLKAIQEPKDLQIKRNQDDMSESSKEPTRNLQFQNPKPCGPGLSEAVDRQVIIIENIPTVISHTNRQVYNPVTATDSGSVRSSPEELHRNLQVQTQKANGEELKENPFFKLRSSLSLLPDVHKDIQEVKKREEELRKQRMSLYGNGSKVTASPSRTTPTHSHANTPGQHLNTTPVSSSFGKLDLTWPPPSLQNGHKPHSEVKEQRQTNLLVQRWESGLINGHGDDHHN